VAVEPVTLSYAESHLFEALNSHRASLGLPPVELVDELVCAARVHSRDLGAVGMCEHVGSDGSTPESRVAGCGGLDWDGEIISCGHRTPERAIAAWMRSSSHRDVLVEPSLRRVGVAMQDNYWVAVFSP
jgi:uncharacterized protein YkwD